MFLRKYSLYNVNSNFYSAWMLPHLPWTLWVFLAIAVFSSKTKLPQFHKNWLPDTIWLVRNNWWLDKYLWLFLQFVFDVVFCTNTAVQLLFLVYSCCYGFLHGDSHWCFPFTGACFQCAVCSLIHWILKEPQQILQCLPTSALLLLYCSRGCFYLFGFCFYYSCLTWSRLEHLCWIQSS